MLNLALQLGQTKTPEAILFWILAPMSVLAALGMLVVGCKLVVDAVV